MSKIDTSPGRINRKKRLPKVKGKKHCEHCNRLSRVDRHHIVYEPEIIALLCRKCHEKITEWNTKASRMLGHALSNVERVKVWIRFMKREAAESELNRVVATSSSGV